GGGGGPDLRRDAGGVRRGRRGRRSGPPRHEDHVDRDDRGPHRGREGGPPEGGREAPDAVADRDRDAESEVASGLGRRKTYYTSRLAEPPTHVRAVVFRPAMSLLRRRSIGQGISRPYAVEPSGMAQSGTKTGSRQRSGTRRYRN